MGLTLNKKDILNTDNTLNEFIINPNDGEEYFILPEREKPTLSNIEDRIKNMEKKNIDYEIKSNIISEYNHLKNVKSLKEQKKVENKLNILLKENGL